MYLNFLFNLAYFFIGAAILFVLVAFKWKVLARYWKIAKIKGQNKKEKIDFIKKQKDKGLKPFSFDRGNTIIYARNGNIALADYKRLNNESRRITRTLKKVK